MPGVAAACRLFASDEGVGFFIFSANCGKLKLIKTDGVGNQYGQMPACHGKGFF